MPTDVLLISAGIVHPSLSARLALRQALQAGSEWRYVRRASLEALPALKRAGHLSRYSAILLYLHRRALSAQALGSLTAYLEAGGGLLALHSAAASFKDEPRFQALLGGRFVQHGPVTTFEVRPALAGDEIFPNLPAFTVVDELYRHEYDPANRVHFYTEVDGEREPVVWTRQHGRGRVAYCSLGHRAAVFRQPPLKQILHRALRWVSAAQAGGTSPG